VPTAREDVGEHRVVVFFLLGVLGQLQAVEVGERNAEVLGLATLVTAHFGIAVGATGHQGLTLRQKPVSPCSQLRQNPQPMFERDRDAVAVAVILTTTSVGRSMRASGTSLTLTSCGP
jgi:hypothetical protein